MAIALTLVPSTTRDRSSINTFSMFFLYRKKRPLALCFHAVTDLVNQAGWRDNILLEKSIKKTKATLATIGRTGVHVGNYTACRPHPLYIKNHKAMIASDAVFFPKFANCF